MKEHVDNYWMIRLNDLKSSLEKNNFEVFLADTTKDAEGIVLNQILPDTKPVSISWGGSLTYRATGLYDILKENPDLEVLDTFDTNLTREESIERRRQALLVDLFITGTNAVTESGQLVNLDMIGNRVGAITFGPKHVVLLVGRNKLVVDLEEAMNRIKTYAAPVNAIRLDMKTPCCKTGVCSECSSPTRICNSWTITEKSFPKKRIKVILVNEDLGF
jgi:L-lactate utilization protein LutB